MVMIFAALFYSDKVEVRCNHYNFLNFFIQKSYDLVRAYWPISKKRIFVFRSNLGIFANPSPFQNSPMWGAPRYLEAYWHQDIYLQLEQGSNSEPRAPDEDAHSSPIYNECKTQSAQVLALP